MEEDKDIGVCLIHYFHSPIDDERAIARFDKTLAVLEALKAHKDFFTSIQGLGLKSPELEMITSCIDTAKTIRNACEMMKNIQSGISLPYLLNSLREAGVLIAKRDYRGISDILDEISTEIRKCLIELLFGD